MAGQRPVHRRRLPYPQRPRHRLHRRAASGAQQRRAPHHDHREPLLPGGPGDLHRRGPTFQYNNGLTGNAVGTTIANSQTYDAVEISGADNNADESDTGRYLPLTSTAYSYNGQYVCHDGQRSAALGHETPCGIKVTNQDTTFAVGGYTARGVEGIDVNGWGSVGGDSGATVFASTGSTRQARGIVSTVGQDNTPDQKRVDWTEATDIFNTFGLRLNPTT